MERECGSSKSSSLRSSLRSLPWWERASLAGILLSTPIAILIWCAVAALACASGCGRTVLVPESSPVRIGPDCRSRVYAMNGSEWRLSENEVTIPEGWYCVPPSFVEEREE
jgi:hypothetical protein